MKIKYIKDGYISTRTTKETERFFKGNNIKGSGMLAWLALESFQTLYEATIKKLKVTFNNEELVNIIYLFRNRQIDPYHRNSLTSIFKDAHEYVAYYPMDVKIQAISLAESFFIEIWANIFWNGDCETDIPADYVRLIKSATPP